MKARVKATGEIVDGKAMVSFNGDDFYLDELEVIQDDADKEYDEFDATYWENMKHQYAGMAMNALLLTNNIRNGDLEGMRECNTNAMAIAHALVEKLKEEK